MAQIETFETQIAKNKRRSFWIMTALVWLLTIGGFIVGGLISDGDTSVALITSFNAAALSFIGIVVAYNYGDKIVLSIAGAKPLMKVDDPELFNVVEEMSIAANVKMPRVYIIQDEAMNAFATGRSPNSAAVAITSGLRKQLSRDELQGVIAHEVAHIINYDIRLMMVAGVIGGAVALIADVMLRSRPRRSSNGKSAGGIFIIAGVLFALLAPFVARLLQLAVSREREYLADATAVKLTRNPNGLMSALATLSGDPDPLDCKNRALEHLYIVSPTRKLKNANKSTIWSTHPAIESRINRLRSLTV